MANGKEQRVLIVEDEILLAFHLEDLLLAMGYQVVGPATRLPEAMAIAREDEFDFAVLDMNLAGASSLPVADILRKRRIPFVFATGYGSEGVAGGCGDELILRKPYATKDLERAVQNGLA
ncbi:MAG: response regulator [Janthinobacterium lividum]